MTGTQRIMYYIFGTKEHHRRANLRGDTVEIMDRDDFVKVNVVEAWQGVIEVDTFFLELHHILPLRNQITQQIPITTVLHDVQHVAVLHHCPNKRQYP